MKWLDLLAANAMARSASRRWLCTGGWLLALMLWGGSAWSQPLLANCTTRQYTISPVIGGLINVPQVVGTILYTGTVSTTFECDMGKTPGVLILGTNLGSQTFVRNSGRTLGVRPNGSQTFTMVALTGNCTGSASPTSSGLQNFVTVNVNTSTGRCRFHYSYTFNIQVAAVPTVDVDFPPDYAPVDNLSQSPSCTFRDFPANPRRCSWVIQGGAGEPNLDYINAGPTFAARFVQIACTLTSPTTTTVSLSPANTAELAAPGSVAQTKTFQIDLAGCAARTNAYAINTKWTYAPDAGLATMIQNTASSPAANVGVQILDDLDNVIANNGVVQLGTMTSTGSGTFSKTFKARYVSKGSAGPGAVTGVAQFTLSYQ